MLAAQHLQERLRRHHAKRAAIRVDHRQRVHPVVQSERRGALLIGIRTDSREIRLHHLRKRRSRIGSEQRADWHDALQLVRGVDDEHELHAWRFLGSKACKRLPGHLFGAGARGAADDMRADSLMRSHGQIFDAARPPPLTCVKIGSMPVFSARGLTKTYRMGETEIHALRGVDLEIDAGEFIVLLGPSGSGKSTLLNILGGLDTPSSGSISFKDDDLSSADEAALTAYRRKHVGFVFQFYNLIPSLTARENVALVTDIASQPMPAAEALTWVGLGKRLDHFPSQLSGGEQQRVAIARAIAKRPDVLLCDEPTGALDYQTGKLVLEVIARINAELGTTAMVITHNAAIAAIADRVLRLGDGRIVGTEKPAHKLTAAEISW